MQTQFDTVARGLLAQGKKSVEEGGICVYRGAGGTKCAIGFLIPDALYKPELENNTVEELQEAMPEVFPYSIWFYLELRVIHDIYSPEVWEIELRKLARQYGLTMPEMGER